MKELIEIQIVLRKPVRLEDEDIQGIRKYMVMVILFFNVFHYQKCGKVFVHL